MGGPSKSKHVSVPVAVSYAYETKKRTTAEGRALAARGGDRAEIRRLCDMGQLILAGVVEGRAPKSGDLRETADWLAFILAEIVRGRSPNEAFGWETGKRGPKKGGDYETLERKSAILRDARLLAERLCKCSVQNAATIVREYWEDFDLFDLSEPWGRVVTRRAGQLSMAQARMIAAELMAAKHRANDPTTPWGRYSLGEFVPVTAAYLADHLSRSDNH